jgi:hypothetical protein
LCVFTLQKSSNRSTKKKTWSSRANN